jgi:hypothetical protein
MYPHRKDGIFPFAKITNPFALVADAPAMEFYMKMIS